MLTPIGTQTHEHPPLRTLTPVGTLRSGYPLPWPPKPMDTQPVHPPSQAPTSAAPIPRGTPPMMGTHPVHPPPRTLTSPSTHLTNTQPHHTRTHLTRRSPWQTPESNRYPHRSESPPVGTHTTEHPRQQAPTHLGLLILGLAVPCSLLQGNLCADAPWLAQPLPPRTG